jgi:hypothetical protein
MFVAFTGAADGETGWHVIATPQPSPDSASQTRDLVSVVALSSSNVWAGGSYLDPGVGHSVPLVLHWTGRRWHRATLPTVPGDRLITSVVASGPSNVWAIGFGGKPVQQGLPLPIVLFHYAGSAWHRMANHGLTVGFESFGAATTGPKNLWLGGDDLNFYSDPLLEHWNGAKWTLIRLPYPPSPPNSDIDNFGQVSGLALVPGASRPTVVGSYVEYGTDRHPYAARFTTTGWLYEAAPGISGSLGSVVMLSANNGWAVGADTNGTLIRHWNGRSWTTSASPNRAGANSLVTISASGPKNVWAVGSSQSRTLAEHWDGRRWTIAATANPSSAGTDAFFADSVVPGSKQTWAVGTYGPSRPNAQAEYNLTERTN